jgi:hypothetical protein
MKKYEAYEFCQDFNRDRLWCARNGINVNELSEEAKFQELLVSGTISLNRQYELMRKSAMADIQQRFEEIQQRKRAEERKRKIISMLTLSPPKLHPPITPNHQ